MINNRIYTFLELCNVMNYRETAERLNMTQPAVTQHIQFLEKQYNCKLFEYHSKILTKTWKCKELEWHARSLLASDVQFKKMISDTESKKIIIGVTKTIGEYMIDTTVMNLMEQKNIELEIVVDNTQQLLKKLNNVELDLLMIEGFFDKERYNYKLIRKEELVGICAKNHPFAGKVIALEECFGEHLIVREDGSGTQVVFEHMLQSKNYTLQSFHKKTTLSSFKLIEKAVEENKGISFVYHIIAQNNGHATFRIKQYPMFHEFNYVFLKNTKEELWINLLEHGYINI